MCVCVSLGQGASGKSNLELRKDELLPQCKMQNGCNLAEWVGITSGEGGTGS